MQFQSVLSSRGRLSRVMQFMMIGPSNDRLVIIMENSYNWKDGIYIQKWSYMTDVLPGNIVSV